MNKITIFLVTALLVSFNCFSQTVIGEVIYLKKNYNPDFNYKAKSVEYKENTTYLINEMNKASKQLKFKLEFSSLESKFTLVKLLQKQNDFYELASTLSGGNGVYYINKQEGVILHQTELGGNSFRIVKQIDSFVWKIINETKKIGKYLCYKATTHIVVRGRIVTNKLVTAWYCPDIPFSFGPTEYCNLPGLILELNIEKGATFMLESIHLKNTKKTIKKPKKGKIVSEDEFQLIAKKMYFDLREGN